MWRRVPGRGRPDGRRARARRMTDPRQGSVRIWESALPAAARGRGPAEHAPGLEALAMPLAEQELLRSSVRPGEYPEPLSLSWYVALEELRLGRHGRWLPKLLEFSRHKGDRILGLGGGLGSDWVRYALHGAEVVAACASADHLALVRRNFE